ncbi:DUF1259 domain-containing protein [Streptomyces sp. NPDC048441]|uniref:DUF1259 domain-containing protein n=1 Tax=Streptomyces sp. NPDC048441 TaxID=3365552 RepID=UPI00371CDAB8
MNGQRGNPAPASAAMPRRHLLASAVAAPAVLGAGAAVALPGGEAAARSGRHAVKPRPSGLADWKEVARALGRAGDIKGGVYYHTAFPRDDLRVVSHGITVTAGLALGSHVAFVRYEDGSSLLMGDLVIAEHELQDVSDALHEHGLTQTSIHKHLLAQDPDVWWMHVHGHGHDPVRLARGLRAALKRTGTPPAAPAVRARLDLDTAGIDKALRVKGFSEDGVYKVLFARRETIVDGHQVLPRGLGSTTAFNLLPLGRGRAALHGDFAMVAGEVDDVLSALRRGGMNLVSLHNHLLEDEPRLFFTHIWAVDDAVSIARALRPALDATNVRAVPVPTKPPAG